MQPNRIHKAAAALSPATLLKFHEALKRRKYRRLFSSGGNCKRVADIEEIKTVPYIPLPHPLVERLIGTVRQEFLDHMLFWNAYDLEQKLENFKQYYNCHRVYSSLGDTPAVVAAADTPKMQSTLKNFRWQIHCRGHHQLPAAA